MCRVDRPRIPIVGHQRDSVDLRLCQPGVGRDDADGGVLARTRGRDGPARAQNFSRIGERTVGGPGARHDPAGGRIDNVADRVDRNDRGDDETTRQRDGRGAESGLRGPEAARRRSCVLAESAKLAYGRTGARANAAFGDGTGRRRCRRPVAAVRRGSDLRIITDGQIKNSRGRHDRDLARDSRKADVVLFEPLHDASRRIKTKRAPAGEDDGIHALDHVQRIQKICFARRGGRSPLRHPAHGVAVDENHRAAGRSLGQREVPHFDAGDRGECSVRGARLGGKDRGYTERREQKPPCADRWCHHATILPRL